MNKLNVLLPIGAALILSSCGSDSKFSGFTRAEQSGLHYKFFNHNESGTKVQEGDGLTFRYIITKFPGDSVIVDSKNVSEDGSGYTRFLMNKSSFKGSFEDGLMMMSKGDSAAFIIPADSFFLKTMHMNELPKGIKPGEFLKGVFAVKDVKSKKEIEENRSKQMAEQEAAMKEMMTNEKTSMDKYLADNKITTAPTASGLIFIEKSKGKGNKPQQGDTVEVNYVGKLLDGTMFDTSIESEAKSGNIHQPGRPYKPIKFPIGTGYVIPGWDEGISMMTKGSKAKLIVPSSIGYGMQGTGPIPPFATLVFDVELVNFKSSK